MSNIVVENAEEVSGGKFCRETSRTKANMANNLN